MGACLSCLKSRPPEPSLPEVAVASTQPIPISLPISSLPEQTPIPTGLSADAVLKQLAVKEGLDKEKLKEISQYLEQVFDFSEFIKESEKYPSTETVNVASDGVGEEKDYPLGSSRETSSASLYDDCPAEGDIANMMLGKRTRNALAMMDEYIKDILRETSAL